VLLEEIAEMAAQLKRCKTIVSGILLSAGEARGESSARPPCASSSTPWCRTARHALGGHFVYDNLPKTTAHGGPMPRWSK
jgi:two-component system sensor histidine kinase RegB